MEQLIYFLLILYVSIAIGFAFSLCLFLLQGKQNVVNVIFTWILFIILFPVLLGMVLGIWAYKQGLTKFDNNGTKNM